MHWVVQHPENLTDFLLDLDESQNWSFGKVGGRPPQSPPWLRHRFEQTCLCFSGLILGHELGRGCWTWYKSAVGSEWRRKWRQRRACVAMPTHPSPRRPSTPADCCCYFRYLCPPTTSYPVPLQRRRSRRSRGPDVRRRLASPITRVRRSLRVIAPHSARYTATICLPFRRLTTLPPSPGGEYIWHGRP